LPAEEEEPHVELVLLLFPSARTIALGNFPSVEHDQEESVPNAGEVHDSGEQVSVLLSPAVLSPVQPCPSG